MYIQNMFSHSSNSREAINETANSDANSADDVAANKSADAPPDDYDGGGGDDDDDDDDDAAAVDEQASWFGMGRLGSAALSLAQGVASAIHQTAVNAAKELAEMERLAGQEAKEEKKARQHERNENDLCTTTKDSGRSSTGTSALSLPLPWQVPSTANGRGTQQESSNDDDNSLLVPLVEDEVLKVKILALARTKSAFEGPFTVENTNATTTTFPANDDDQESPTYFTKDRVELIERLFSIDKNLAKAHALVTFGATEEKAEELFFRNYFHHTEEERANHTIRDEELDIDIVLQTPPSSPDQHNRPLISALSVPRHLSIDDLVIIG